MKLKVLAAACAAIGSAGAFAACPSNATVNGACVIQPTTTTYYVAGASAQSQALNAIAKSVFDTPADVIQIQSGATSIQSHVAYYGLRGGVKTLLVYRNSGGSGAGVRQILSNTPAAYTALPGAGTENSAITLGTCGIVSGAAGSYVANCTSNTTRVADIALFDVRAEEHALGVVPTPGPNYVSAAALTLRKTGLQGFGVIVNPPLHAALVAQNAREGIPVDATGQPSLRRADYASLISTQGNIKFASDLLNDPADTTLIRVCRRVDTSGTQAASNIFFLNNPIGTQGFGGSLNSESVNNGDTNYSLGSSTQNVKDCLNGVSPANPSSEYRLGVVSLENVPAGNETWKFVKLDSVSPNFTQDLATGTVVFDPKQRQQFAKASYPFAFESELAYRTAPSQPGTAALGDQMANLISQSGLSDLVGFGYLDRTFLEWNAYDSTLASPANKQARGNRASNNARPLLP